MAAYLHKKFKKLASVEVEPEESSPSQDVGDTLKHSVGSMVAAPVPSPEPSRNICPHCGLVCHKPSVLEKHMR